MTVIKKPENLVMKLEGRLVGPWVAECRQAWTTLPLKRSTRRLSLDLCDVTFVDESGLDLLREIYRATRADIVVGSPLTKHFAERAKEFTNGRRKGE